MLRGPDTSERVFRGSLPLQLFYKKRCVKAGNSATLQGCFEKGGRWNVIAMRRPPEGLATSGIVAEGGEMLSPGLAIRLLGTLGVMIRQDVLCSQEHSLAAAVTVQRGVAVPAILPCGSAGRARLFDASGCSL